VTPLVIGTVRTAAAEELAAEEDLRLVPGDEVAVGDGVLGEVVELGEPVEEVAAGAGEGDRDEDAAEEVDGVAAAESGAAGGGIGQRELGEFLDGHVRVERA
jgi:hypothetical protein